MTPMTEATRDRLRQRFLDRHADLVPEGPNGIAPGDSLPRRPYVRSDERAIGYVPYSKGELPTPLPATLVAFYLPQFHTIPENDEWWGKGFTEWRNVTRALPQFEGHQQPRLPGDLGFYDLRNPEVMREQARLAGEYGISAFCFYFYWFGGKTLLESPLEQWLKDDSIALSYCLCWANENWTRRWDGRSEDILIAQQHSAEDDLAFIAHIGKYLRDPRYLRVKGEPLLLVYRPDLLPAPKETAKRWRNWCRDNGIGEIHIAYVQSFERPDPRDLGFDAAVEFPPNLSNPRSMGSKQQLINPRFHGQVLDWRGLAADYSSRKLSPYRLYPGINAGWDNEPRAAGKGRVYLHASPRGYGDWLQNAIRRLQGFPAAEKLAFINAWNEWAEGAVLEPDARLGHAYLSATRRALNSSSRSVPAPKAKTLNHVVVHAWYLDAFDEIVASLESSGVAWYLIVTTGEHIAEEIGRRLSDLAIPSEIVVSENRGRDVLPFLRVADRLIDEGVDFVLKLHTKRSAHLTNGEHWRREIVQQLLSGDRAASVLRAFEKQPELGLVAPEGHVRSLFAHEGNNAEMLESLNTRMGLATPMGRGGLFVAGSMFWARLGALRALLDADLGEAEFAEERGQVDGTMAHAIERIFAHVAMDSGFLVTCADAPEGPAAVPNSSSYPYAR